MKMHAVHLKPWNGSSNDRKAEGGDGGGRVCGVRGEVPGPAIVDITAVDGRRLVQLPA